MKIGKEREGGLDSMTIAIDNEDDEDNDEKDHRECYFRRVWVAFPVFH